MQGGIRLNLIKIQSRLWWAVRHGCFPRNVWPSYKSRYLLERHYGRKIIFQKKNKGFYPSVWAKRNHFREEAQCYGEKSLLLAKLLLSLSIEILQRSDTLMRSFVHISYVTYQGLTFMHDKAPAHRAILTTVLQANNIPVLNMWPGFKSSEHFWILLDHGLSRRQHQPQKL